MVWTTRGPSRSRPPQEAELEPARRERDHLGARPLEQVARSRGGAAGGEDVVDDQDPVPGANASACTSMVAVPYSRS